VAEQNRFFQWLYRVLAVLALLILSMIAYVFVREIVFPELWPTRHTIKVPNEKGKPEAQAVPMTVGGVTRIKGGAVKMIELSAARPGIAGLRSGSRNYSRDVRNLIFIVDGQPRAKWLFEKNEQLLRAIEQICLCEDRVKSEAESTTAIYLEVIRIDSDGDGVLGAGDRPIPALLRPDGSGYTELGGSVEEVLDTSLSDNGERFGLLIVDGDKLLYREYSVADFSLRAKHILTELNR